MSGTPSLKLATPGAPIEESPMLAGIGDDQLKERVAAAQKWLNEFYGIQGTWDAVKRALRTKYSAAALSGFATGSYTGNALAVTADIETGRKRLEDSARGFAPAYAETSVSLRIQKAVRLTTARGELGLLSTESGLGKSTTFAALRQAQEDAKRRRVGGQLDIFYVLANQTMKFRLWPTLVVLLEAMGLGDQKRSSPAICYSLLCSSLKNSRKMIIFDDAQHFSLQALDTFRTLSEEADTPILFAGNEEVFEFGFLAGSKPSGFTQFASRCLVQEHIRRTDITESDVQLVASQLLREDVLDETLEQLLAAAHQKGAFRRLKAILQRAHEKARGRTVLASHVFAAIDDVAKLRGAA